ncbi:MAG: hypothetical protein ACRCTZ_12975 [Sarcina sp.]
MKPNLNNVIPDLNCLDKVEVLLQYFQNVLNTLDVQNYELLITGDFGVFTGTPIFTNPRNREHLDFNDYLKDHFHITLDLYEAALQEREEFLKASTPPTENDFFLPGTTDTIVFENVTLYSNNQVFNLESFTVFASKISGVSFYKKTN